MAHPRGQATHRLVALSDYTPNFMGAPMNGYCSDHVTESPRTEVGLGIGEGFQLGVVA